MDNLPSFDELKKKTVAQAESLGLTTLSPGQQAVIFALLGSAGTFGLITVRRRFWKRLPNSDHVPPEAFEKRRWVKGDGDNFRLYHTPGLFWRWPIKLRKVPTETKALKDQTLHIRMAGVDAPEAPHFGKAGQPGAEEARLWLENKILGKRLWCQLVYRDQYKRTYEQANAEYGDAGKEAHVRLEEQAKKARRGMWAKGTNIELPGQFKKRMGIESPKPTTTTTLRAATKPSKSIFSWFRRS
ncbi:putative endonuclease lcl3 [Tulasnella sp. 408]|nr:putative endonuclease lcl3 [Tulasnella sp. 408]